MRFRNQLFDFYDSEGMRATFEDVFEQREIGSVPFALSGMGEVREMLLVLKEWYETTCPLIRVLEKRPTDPGIFRDGNGQPASFDREIQLRMSVKEGDRKFNWREQQYIDLPFEAWVSPAILYQLDYFPSAGDVFKWRDLWRQVTAVKVNPTDYFGNTGFPLHIKIESSLWTPELNLETGLPCGPERVFTGPAPASFKKDRAPDVTAIGSDGPNNEGGLDSPDDVSNGSSGPRETGGSVNGGVIAPTCDCPIKTPQCYVKSCSYYSDSPKSRSKSGSCGC